MRPETACRLYSFCAIAFVFLAGLSVGRDEYWWAALDVLLVTWFSWLSGREIQKMEKEEPE